MRRLLSLLLIPLLSLTAYAAPASSGGGGSSGSDDSNIDGWLALGAAAIVAGILIWDIFRDSEPDDAPAHSTVTPDPQETGIDWTALHPSMEDPLILGVSVFPGDRGWSLAQYFQQLLLPLEDRGVFFTGDPINFGGMPPSQQAAMAGDFLGCTWYLAPGSESLLLFDRGAGPVWETAVPQWDSVSVRNAAIEFLQAAPTLR